VKYSYNTSYNIITQVKGTQMYTYIWVPLTCVIICEKHTLSSYLSILDKTEWLLILSSGSHPFSASKAILWSTILNNLMKLGASLGNVPQKLKFFSLYSRGWPSKPKMGDSLKKPDKQPHCFNQNRNIRNQGIFFFLKNIQFLWNVT
jgi:hypothetical protein